MNESLESMKNIVDSSDGGDLGHPGKRSIWLFGIEPGSTNADQLMVESGNSKPVDENYSIETQMTMKFNQGAFKLLAAIEGQSAREYVTFANSRRPFVKGSEGYFKGNLYPVASHDVNRWSEKSQQDIGLSKQEFYEWCRNERYPAIRRLVEQSQPKLIIGSGVGRRNEFARAFFGDNDTNFTVHNSEADHKVRRLYFQERNGVKLIIIPHLSPVGPYCLSSYEAIQNAGKFIADWMKNKTSS